MFCTKCGAQNEDGAMFCCKCGASLKEVQGFSDNTMAENVMAGNVVGSKEDETVKNHRKIGIAVFVAGVVVVAVAIFLLFGGRGYKSTVEHFLDGAIEADVDKFVKVLPEDVVEEEIRELGDNKKKFFREIEDNLEDVIDNIEDNNATLSYDILDAEDVKGSELKDIKEAYEEYDVKVRKAKEVSVRLKAKAKVDGEVETKNETMDIPVVKIGRNWYIDILTIGDMW